MAFRMNSGEPIWLKRRCRGCRRMYRNERALRLSTLPMRLFLVAATTLILGAFGDSATPAPASTAAAGTPTVAATARGDSSAPAGGAAFCTGWAQAAAQAARASGPPSGVGGVNDMKATLEHASSALNSIAGTAPTEIRADLQLYAKAFGEFNTAMAKVNYDFMKMASDPAAMKAAEAMSDPKFEQAGKNIEAWMTKNCTAAGRSEHASVGARSGQHRRASTDTPSETPAVSRAHPRVNAPETHPPQPQPQGDQRRHRHWPAEPSAAGSPGSWPRRWPPLPAPATP